MTDTVTPSASDYAATAREEAERAARLGEDLAAKTETVLGEMRQRIDATSADTRLNDDTKAADIARLKAEASARVQAFGAEAEGGMRRELDELRVRLCSPPATFGAERIATDASFRDAMQRGRTTEQQTAAAHPLLDLFHSAKLTSDTLQERAAMVVALERGDTDVLNAWLETHPEDDKAMNRAYDLHHELIDRKARFARALRFRVG